MATIVAEWVKGHYTGEYREHRHDLNEHADRLANKFNENPSSALKQIKMSCPLSGYAIRLVYDGSTITNKLSKALHKQKFIPYLKQKHIGQNPPSRVSIGMHTKGHSNLTQKITKS
jgi:hypothetical protein